MGAVRSTEEPFRVEVAAGEFATLIAPSGELDAHTAAILVEHVNEVLATGCTQVVLDMAGLRFIDSSGLRVVISAHKRLAGIGGALLVRSPSDTARRLFEITGLAAYLTFEDDR